MLRPFAVLFGLTGLPAVAQGVSPAGLVDQCGGVRMDVALRGDAALTIEDAQAAAATLDSRMPGPRVLGRNLVAEVEVVAEDRLRFHRAGAESFGVEWAELYSRTDALSVYDVIEMTGDTSRLDGRTWFADADDPDWFIIVEPEPAIAPFGVRQAEMTMDHSNRPAVSFRLTDEAGAAFCALTSERIGMPLALVLGDRVMTAPTVQSQICGGNLLISGNFSADEATALAAYLNEGPFEYDVEVLDVYNVMPPEGDVAVCAGLAGQGE